MSTAHADAGGVVARMAGMQSAGPTFCAGPAEMAKS